MKSLGVNLIALFLVVASFAQNNNLLVDEEKVNEEFHDILRQMPSPIEELQDLHHDKVKYNELLLSPAANVKKHQTDAAMAINAGIYMIDFIYLSEFKEQEKMMEYRALAYELAFKLEAGEPFKDLLAVNLEKKIKNFESLESKIDSTLDETEELLISQHRMATATQMMFGSWVETQYILLQSFIRDKKQSDEVKEHIKEQQIHLANLIKLVHEFKDEAGMHNELDKLNQLEASFQKIHSIDEVNDTIVAELTDEITRLRMDILAME